MPGSGKSHFGRILEEELICPLIDLDKEIEEAEERTISDIFEQEGEEYFRQAEARMLRIITESQEEVIISTGGGTPCYHDGLEYMNAHGTTVYLEAEESVLIKRLAPKDHRPLMVGDTEKRVKELLNQRLPVYQKAKITLSHRDPKRLAQELENS
ncbi:shikimate kinase [Marinoscillum furvescens DSM 4134]|uniref:Shikimate kinase n=2 Tax=Marinoscillum furvescens TaxID=1026 RepID=A0A3D9LH26_MARFU|nr:shikimate kinase [Marinoscillum furvescens DSM 4134]